MNIENTQSQMRKGILEFCILSVIRRGEVYPSDIVEEMKAAGLHILEGTLYPLLTRLKNAEMLNYRWVESKGGPPPQVLFPDRKRRVVLQRTRTNLAGTFQRCQRINQQTITAHTQIHTG